MSYILENISKVMPDTEDPLYLEKLAQNITIYLELLQKWNKAYNLTAIHDLDSMLKLHILDSLAILPYIHGENIRLLKKPAAESETQGESARGTAVYTQVHEDSSTAFIKQFEDEIAFPKRSIIDIGTGAGLPGLVIAMAKPDLMITLLDSNGKKIRFLQEVKRVLAISNIDIIQSRAEDYRPSVKFATVVSRAFSSIKKMQEWSRHLIAPQGIWLAMKGQLPADELSVIQSPYQVYQYQVEGIVGQRCCVAIQNI